MSQSILNFLELFPMAHSSLQKFDNDCDVIFLLKMVFDGISLAKNWIEHEI